MLQNHSSIMVSRYHLHVGGLSLIPTAATTITSVCGNAEHASLNHRPAPPYQGVKLVPVKQRVGKDFCQLLSGM